MAEHIHVNRMTKRGGRLYTGASSLHGCVLLYGPPGCGKTQFLKSTGFEFRLAMELISCEHLKEDFIEGVKTQLYFKKLFARARESAPAMIILDNIDEITSKRSLKDLKVRKCVYQLLRELDHIKPGDRILITATSDHPYLIEPLLFKAHRFDKLIFVPMPNSESREALFDLFLKDYSTDDDINIRSLGRISRGFNGLDIKNVVEYADELALEDDSNINMYHLESAVKAVGPSLKPDVLTPIKKFFMHYKSGSLLRHAAGMRSGKTGELYRRKGQRDKRKKEKKYEEVLFELEENEIEAEEVTLTSDDVDWSFDDDNEASSDTQEDSTVSSEGNSESGDDFDIIDEEIDESEEDDTKYRRKWVSDDFKA